MASAKENQPQSIDLENAGLSNSSITTKALASCSTTSDCSSYSGDCRCQGDGKFCFDNTKMNNLLNYYCDTCTAGSCGSGDACWLVGGDYGYCIDCVNQQWSKAECEVATPPPETEKCSASESGSSTCKSINCLEGEGYMGDSLVHGTNCKCECCDGRAPECDYGGSTSYYNTLQCKCVGNIEPVPDCVETQWLEENGHSEGILRKRGLGAVLCIPGLPCGTPGHLLKYCKSASNCSMVTYKELCATDFNCTRETKPVSRLKSSYDWKEVSISGPRFHQIVLSSLSVHEDAKKMSLSYLIANVAQKMADNGLGAVCDFVLLKLLDMAEVPARQNLQVCYKSQFGFVEKLF